MDACCQTPHATYPGAQAGRLQTLPYLVLHQVGFTKLLRSPEERCALTAPFHPYQAVFTLRNLREKRKSRAVYFLLHFPSCYHDSTLWSTLPCGVRTFLRTLLDPAIVCSASAIDKSNMLPVYNPLTIRTHSQFVTPLKFVIHLRWNIDKASMADGILNRNNGISTNLL